LYLFFFLGKFWWEKNRSLSNISPFHSTISFFHVYIL
jgi:hypothetical protein